MRKIFILSVIATILTLAGFAQDTIMIRAADSLAISDSIILISHLPDTASNRVSTVYDNYWVTNCIKSGWKSSDTAMVGLGLEPCDTAHPFIMPVTGKFWRGVTHYHSGWDIGSDKGTPVLAGLNGKVRFSGYSSGYGNLVIVRHYSGMEMYYAHLSKILVAKNEFVDAGDTLGLVGATGRARGNHLHMEFRVCDKALDIADYYVQNDTVVNLWKIFDRTTKPVVPQGEEYHTVVRGDTLWDIASRYGTSVTNLCTINNISRNSTLRIGQTLKVK